MIRPALFVGLAFAAAAAVQAAPYLTADPYPTDDPNKAVPTEFVVTISGLDEPVVTPAVPAGANQVKLWLDLGPLNLTGPRVATAKARNPWGESAPSAPLSFHAGPVSPPTNLRVLY